MSKVMWKVRTSEQGYEVATMFEADKSKQSKKNDKIFSGHIKATPIQMTVCVIHMKMTYPAKCSLCLRLSHIKSQLVGE